MITKSKIKRLEAEIRRADKAGTTHDDKLKALFIKFLKGVGHTDILNDCFGIKA